MNYAKTLLFTLGLLSVLTMQAQTTQANAIDKYFQQYVDDQRFTVVYISPKLFQMLGKLDINKFDDEDETQAIMDIAKDLQGLRILISDENAMNLYKEAKSKINTKEYEPLMTVRDRDGDNVEFLVHESGNIIQELLLLVGGDEFILMSFVGNLDLNKISKLAKSIEDDKKQK